MKVKCKYCLNYKDGYCMGKKSGGKHPSVSQNQSRKCGVYKVNAIALAEEADKEWLKAQIPRFSPTWRYYATDKELKDKGEEKGAKYVRTNPEHS